MGRKKKDPGQKRKKGRGERSPHNESDQKRKMFTKGKKKSLLICASKPRGKKEGGMSSEETWAGAEVKMERTLCSKRPGRCCRFDGKGEGFSPRRERKKGRLMERRSGSVGGNHLRQ